MRELIEEEEVEGQKGVEERKWRRDEQGGIRSSLIGLDDGDETLVWRDHQRREWRFSISTKRS